MKEANRPLLVVEDDTGLQSQLRWCFDDYDVVITGDREAAIAQLRRHGCSRTFVEYTSDSSKNTPKLSRNTHERCHNNTQNKHMDPHQCPA